MRYSLRGAPTRRDLQSNSAMRYSMRREEVLLHLYVTRRGCYTLPMRGLVLVTAPRAL